MKTMRLSIRLITALLALFFILVLISTAGVVSAQETTANPTVNTYELDDDSLFDFEDKDPVTAPLCFGAIRSGTTEIKGMINTMAKFRGVQAYGTGGTVSFQFGRTEGLFQAGDTWVLSDCSESKVADFSLSEPVGNGTAVVQKSNNNSVWESVAEVHDIFGDPEKPLYTTDPRDDGRGVYYRVIVVYELKHQTGEKKVWDFWPVKSHMAAVYEYKRFAEVSVFYICSDSRCVSAREYYPMEGTTDENLIESGDHVEYGFVIDKSVSDNLVTVKLPSGQTVNAGSGQAFLSQGQYTVTETTRLGIKFSTVITVDVGTSYASPVTQVFQSENNTGYGATEESECNQASYSMVTLAAVGGSSIKKDVKNGVASFGIVGSNVSFLFSLNRDSLPAGYRVASDTWGGKEGEYVNGVQTGEVATGALILQKSANGTDWTLCDTGKYQNGVFTTDYENEYGRGYVQFYTPSGEEVINGEYYRVSYAYEITNGVEYLDFIEIATFFVCSDDVNAVTFHNLSLDGSIEEHFDGEDPATVEVAKRSETLIDGSVTVTGFSIDDSLNPTVSISIQKDRYDYVLPDNREIRENGRYDIKIRSKLGTEKNLIIYVCRQTPEELFSLYFGTPLLSGKRIFTKGAYPTYEGGQAKYTIQAKNDSLPALFGTIENKTTGAVIATVSQGSVIQEGNLTVAGEYEARLCTNSTFGTDEPSGDNHVFTFSFAIIPAGSAPGPQVNKDNLSSYVHTSSPSNSYPVYYGVTYSSAYKGYITLAFATEQAAYQYSYQYAKGMVEKQGDGSYRYDGNLMIAQKVKYNSAWDLTDAIDYFARQAVQKLYFDLSDEFTYATLTDELLASTENLRSLELAQSVIIFADETEKAALLNNTGIPIINSQKYHYIVPGRDEISDDGIVDFRFVKDSHGYDSDSVKIIDADGHVYPIQYDESVEAQLRATGCKTGILTVEEKTVYGDITTYQVVYFAENDNTTQFELKYFINETVNTKHITSADAGFSLTVNAFYFEDLVDQLDPYSLIIVQNGTEEESYCIKDIANQVWSETGTYTIKLVNRLGNAYSITLRIEESYYCVAFSGEGTDGLAPVLYTDDDAVVLPNLSRYGYTFAGYRVANGSVYSGEVDALLLKGNAVLETVWQAKKFSMSLYIGDQKYQEQAIAFGETYSLPVFESTPTQTFVGWKNERNETITDLTVNEEGDVRLVAYYVANDLPEGDGTTGSEKVPDITYEGTENKEPDPDESTDLSTIIIGYVVIGLVALLIIVLIVFLIVKIFG